jgi:hypothetical protein
LTQWLIATSSVRVQGSGRSTRHAQHACLRDVDYIPSIEGQFERLLMRGFHVRHEIVLLWTMLKGFRGMAYV